MLSLTGWTPFFHNNRNSTNGCNKHCVNHNLWFFVYTCHIVQLNLKKFWLTFRLKKFQIIIRWIIFSSKLRVALRDSQSVTNVLNDFKRKNNNNILLRVCNCCITWYYLLWVTNLSLQLKDQKLKHSLYDLKVFNEYYS